LENYPNISLRKGHHCPGKIIIGILKKDALGRRNRRNFPKEKPA